MIFTMVQVKFPAVISFKMLVKHAKKQFNRLFTTQIIINPGKAS